LPRHRSANAILSSCSVADQLAADRGFTSSIKPLKRLYA